jgi:molybdopterin converting factor small subunit
MMRFTVRLFARARDLAGADVIAVELAEGSTVRDLRGAVARACPALAGLLERSAIALAHDFAGDERVVLAGVEIALLPPVSGGEKNAACGLAEVRSR